MPLKLEVTLVSVSTNEWESDMEAMWDSHMSKMNNV